MWGRFFIVFFFVWMASSIRTDKVHDSTRIHAKYSKIQQNTFGGIHTLDLGEIATKPDSLG